MVESSRAKINFIKLNSKELSSKIALLVSNKQRVIFWKNSPRYLEGYSHSFSIKENKTQLLLERSTNTIKLIGEKICLHFVLNEIDYFIKGKVVEQIEIDQQLLIELDDECFRAEKRSRERLLTYPLYEVYAYFKYKKPNKGNVYFLNKGEQKTRDFFSEIDNREKAKMSYLSKDLNLEDEEDIVGFRVEDLSSTGLSFFANTKEKELISDELNKNLSHLVLNFEMQVFNLEQVSIVYMMNYINPQFSGVPMFKVGICFNQSIQLKRKIEEVSGIMVDLIDYHKEFEEFIKNE